MTERFSSILFCLFGVQGGIVYSNMVKYYGKKDLESDDSFVCTLTAIAQTHLIITFFNEYRLS